MAKIRITSKGNYMKLRKALNPFHMRKAINYVCNFCANTIESQTILKMLIKMQNGQLQDATQHRNEKLLNILRYVQNHCPYYKNLFLENNINPNSLKNFGQIPLLDKATVRTHFNELLSDEVSSLSTYTMNTGGSTGEPFEFIVSTLAGVIDKVHQEFVFKTTMGYKEGDKIVAFDGSTVPEECIKSHIYWIQKSDQDIPYGRLSYSSLYLTKENIQYYVQNIIDTAPCILRGYPSFINSIAEYILNENINIPFKVKGVQLTAEMANDAQIDNIERAFNTKVYLQYGHSEVCVYGFTFDATQEYYCSPFYGYTEVLDETGRPVDKGEVGEVVVTGFYNFAMPFIRYRTGDLAVFNGDNNGVVALQKIIGRTQDYVITKDGEKISLTALIFGQHYAAFKHIEKWQLQQDIPGKVHFRIVKAKNYSEKDEQEIQRKFRGIGDIDTEFKYVSSIPLTKRGKYKFLIQNIIH